MNFVAVELFKKTITKRIILGVFCLAGVTLAARIASATAGEMASLPQTSIASVKAMAAGNEDIRADYRFTDSKFVKDAKDKNSVQTEVGETGSTEFKPDLTVSKWNGEASFKVKPDISDVANNVNKLIIVGEQINYRTDKKDYVYYDDPSASENGGFEFKIILNEKPDTNTFSEAVESSGVEFYPQLPLNEEPQEPGIVCTATECKDSEGRVVLSRAEDVVDSIAVYATGKSGDYTALGGMNYGTGKVAQIKRVKAIDANGNSAYCKQTIADGVWTKTCPQDFLDDAAYPVVIDPTFGYTTAGSSFFDGIYNVYMRGGGDSYTGVVGRGQKISAYAKKIVREYVSETDDHLLACVYEKTGDFSGTKLENGNTREVVINDMTPGWWDMPFVTSPLFGATDYKFLFSTNYTDHDPANIAIAYDTAGTTNGFYDYNNWYYPDWPDSYSGEEDDYHGLSRYSIYVTYSAGLAPVIIINNPNTAPAQSKTITATAGGGTLTMSNTSGSACDDSLEFVTYASQIFSQDADNGTKVCYRAVGADGTTYLLSDAIAGIDATPPTITGLSDDGTPTKSKTWSWGANETATYRYSINRSLSSTPTGAYNSTVTASQTSGNGTYYIHVQAKDALGNVSAVTTVSAILDNTAPVITITNPNGDSAQSKTIAATANEGNLSMSNTTGSVCNGTLSFIAYSSQTFTSEGDNGARVCYRASDTAGNISYTLSGAISGIDATGPTITGLTTDTMPAKTKTWSWSSEAGATFRLVIDNNASSTVSGIYDSTATATQSAGDGTYYLHVQAKDVVGNESSVVTVSAILDNTPPAITVSGTNPVSVTFGSTYADDGATAADNIDASVTVNSSGSVDTATAGDYTITYNATDAAGNAATPATRTVRVAAPSSTAEETSAVAAVSASEPVPPAPGQYTLAAKLALAPLNPNDQARLSGQIEYLRSEIARLRNLLAATGSDNAAPNSCPAITKNLFYGMTDDAQVLCLQEFLKGQDASIYPEAKVTGNFFDATKAAVIRFQEKLANKILAPIGLKRGTGFVGLKTRQAINSLLY